MVSQSAIIRFGTFFALLLVACAEGYDPSLDDNARAINDELEQKVRGVDDAVTRITKTKLFKCGDLRRQGQTFKCRGWRNRIPSLLLVGSGSDETLIAFASKRKENLKNRGGHIYDWWHETDVIAAISHDRGKTWSETIQVASRADTDIHRGPVIYEKETKTIYQFMRYVPVDIKRGLKPEDYKKETTVEQMLEDRMGDYVTHSKDFGRTWSEPISIDFPYPSHAIGVGVGNGNHGIQLASGRLVIQGRYFMDNGRNGLKSQTVLFYSDEKRGLRKGNKWTLGPVLNPGGVRMSPQEFTLAESPMNVVLANFKTCDVHNGRVKVRIANAETIIEPANHDSNLHAGLVHASMARNPNGYQTYFFGIPGAQHPQPEEDRCGANRESRHRMTLYRGSYNGSNIDWSDALQIDRNSRFAGYSDMVVFNNGSVGIIYESGDSWREEDEEEVFAYMTYQHLKVSEQASPAVDDQPDSQSSSDRRLRRQAAEQPRAEGCEPIPAGHFFVGNTGFYSNGSAFCGLSSWDDWIASGGPDNANDARRFDALPPCMDNHGICQVNRPEPQPA
ncbi:MAG: hypothetical protein ACON3Z_16230, partial [Bradymonadia bacterium]